jgi:hypothetical protein
VCAYYTCGVSRVNINLIDCATTAVVKAADKLK